MHYPAFRAAVLFEQFEQTLYVLVGVEEIAVTQFSIATGTSLKRERERERERES